MLCASVEGRGKWLICREPIPCVPGVCMDLGWWVVRVMARHSPIGDVGGDIWRCGEEIYGDGGGGDIWGGDRAKSEEVCMSGDYKATCSVAEDSVSINTCVYTSSTHFHLTLRQKF